VLKAGEGHAAMAFALVGAELAVES
jgi:hypothetical protein